MSKKNDKNSRLFCGQLLRCSLAMIICIAFISCFVVTAMGADLSSLKKQAEELESQSSALQSQIDDLENQVNSKLEEKALLEQQISVLSAQIATTEELIAEYDDQIAEVQIELDEARAEEDKYYDLFCERIRDMEERGNVTFWSVLFGSTSFTDLLDRISFVSEVMEYDQEILQGLENARRAVEAAKTALEENKNEQQTAKESLEAQQAELTSTEAAVDAAIAEINSQADIYESQLKEIQAQAEDLENQIAQAQASSASRITITSSSSSGSARINMIWPTTSYRVTSEFGNRSSPTAGASTNHKGIDIGASEGSPIYAAASGTVTEAGYNSSRGNYVVISHGSGVSTVYMHCSALYVSSGQSVTQGETIAAVGSTGISTGPHLHFGVIVDGSYVNPRNYVG